MNDPLEQARALFLQGLSLSEQGQLEPAAQHFEAALALAPGRASILMNLALTRIRMQHFDQAEPLLRSALAADEAQSDAWAALGLVQMELGQWGQALHSHERAVVLGADTAAVRMRLGQCLARGGQHDQALAAFDRAIELDAGLAEAWSQKGHLLREMHRLQDAAECYRRALELGADAELHSYYLAALEPDAIQGNAPRRYVEALFDQYADDFEDHLLQPLRYQGHSLLIAQLPAPGAALFKKVLDLGCGTGLCGPLVRARSGFLCGVDLSAAMVDKTRARGVYDRVVQADLVDFLAAETEHFDLVLAADVFIYVGRLEQVFAQLAKRIPVGGLLAFTLEEAGPGFDVELRPSLRYGHSIAYVEALAAEHGFEWAASHSAPIRFDQQQAIPGRYVYLRKGGAPVRTSPQSTPQ
ncbi:MAG: tetratricopeptide repeat protein [Burkholderiaceae bacterium]|nr:tetratricopeptide repeat protein [Burkholderiaceae bacterium]